MTTWSLEVNWTTWKIEVKLTTWKFDFKLTTLKLTLLRSKWFPEATSSWLHKSLKSTWQLWAKLTTQTCEVISTTWDFEVKLTASTCEAILTTWDFEVKLTIWDLRLWGQIAIDYIYMWGFFDFLRLSGQIDHLAAEVKLT